MPEPQPDGEEPLQPTAASGSALSSSGTWDVIAVSLSPPSMTVLVLCPDLHATAAPPSSSASGNHRVPVWFQSSALAAQAGAIEWSFGSLNHRFFTAVGQHGHVTVRLSHRLKLDDGELAQLQSAAEAMTTGGGQAPSAWKAITSLVSGHRLTEDSMGIPSLDLQTTLGDLETFVTALRKIPVLQVMLARGASKEQGVGKVAGDGLCAYWCWDRIMSVRQKKAHKLCKLTSRVDLGHLRDDVLPGIQARCRAMGDTLSSAATSVITVMERLQSLLVTVDHFNYGTPGDRLRTIDKLPKVIQDDLRVQVQKKKKRGEINSIPYEFWGGDDLFALPIWDGEPILLFSGGDSESDEVVCVGSRPVADAQASPFQDCVAYDMVAGLGGYSPVCIGNGKHFWLATKNSGKEYLTTADIVGDFKVAVTALYRDMARIASEDSVV